ncbi:PROTEIN WVD2-LIKE 7 [Salix purpurea]|uniref:PROTEIN WVD2-LIKE 7 n=1 Tax=Salix purpurea TaxID=77065 RepID=A0A9Q0TW78_SALPP|nr:PROTEIN WVD2-LIKE 7 [Salix purpurea]
MAGELQEPLSFGSCISFQVDSLHSGSISFGRFESEDLSWERRSSFSHNRYLEEVEKCSKPGSVIQKKAYFEAHFKKKGILRPDSLDGLSGRGCQNCEDDEYGLLGHGEEDDSNGSCNYSHREDDVLESVDCDEFDGGNQGDQFDHVNDESHRACFDESPEDSEYYGQLEVIECGREDPIVLSSESPPMEAALDDASVLVKGVDDPIVLSSESPPVEAALDDANVLVKVVDGYVKHEESHQIETGLDESHLSNDKQEMEIKDNLNDNAAKIDESSVTIALSPKRGTAKDLDNASPVHQQNLSPKLRDSVGSKSTKPRMRSPLNGNQFQKIPHNVSKSTAKTQNRGESETPQRANSEKQSSRAATPTRRTLHRAKNEENSESANVRLHPAGRSERESRVKKFESPPSRSKKVEPISHLRANRDKQVVHSIKPDTMPCAAAFSFKSDERAERRKEFYMKLEEKLHEKEAEMNQIQAKTQEQKEAEIKKLRQRLNFKATPMPSFYSVAAPPSSNGNKASSSKTKPAKVRHRSTSPGSGAAARSQLLSRTGNDQAVTANESVKTTNHPDPSGRTDHRATNVREARETSPTNNNKHKPEAVTKIGVTGKNERGKGKDANLQRHQVSEHTRASNGLKVEGKAKTRSHGSINEVSRKSIKRIGNGSNTGTGNLAAGVALLN